MTDRAPARGPGADLSRLWLPTDAALADALQVVQFGREIHRRLLITSAAATLVACAVPRAPTQAAALRSFYVATNGNNANAGTQASPWRTIDRALSMALLPGDEIVVGPGTYTGQVWVQKGGNADTANGYVTLRSALPGQALLRPQSGAYSTLNVNANFVIVDGFDVVGGSGHAIDTQFVHHVKIFNCIAHDSGGSGISFNRCEWIWIEGNRVFKNAATNGYQCSGISIYQCRRLSGDISTPGFRTVARNNISWGNIELFGGADHTDGNGIIIDDFQSTQTSGFPNYTFPTLVENNLCYSNGGKGIQVTWSDYVTVRNNTCWRNSLDKNMASTWRAELNNAQSSNNRWINNIGVADPSVHSANTGIGNVSYGGYQNVNTVWYNNLTFNGTIGQSSLSLDGGNPGPSVSNGNRLGVDPQFVAPAASGGNFRLRAGSPAIGTGTTAFGVATTDLAGNSRVAGGAVDIGAYEHDGSTSPPPEEPPPEPPPSGNVSLWGTSVRPAQETVNDAQAVELGIEFRVASAGFITGIRFYKGPRNTGTHRVSLWNSSGTGLASASATNETASGWQEVRFAQPVAVQAGVLYVASYHAPNGYYSANNDYFNASVVNGPITAPGNGNGVYAYGSGGIPRNTYRKSNYWVDVLFRAA